MVKPFGLPRAIWITVCVSFARSRSPAYTDLKARLGYSTQSLHMITTYPWPEFLARTLEEGLKNMLTTQGRNPHTLHDYLATHKQLSVSLQTRELNIQ